MTTELEKTFFDTFEIHSHFDPWLGDIYPQITDSTLLKLICYMTVQQYQLVISNKRTIDDLKKYILKKCIKDYSKNEYLKHQVQAIFEDRK